MARTFRRARGDSPRAAIWNGRCPGLGAIAPEPGAKCPREAVPRENGSGEGRVESASDDDVAGGGDKSNGLDQPHRPEAAVIGRSEEHTSELQSLMRNSYAVFCLQKKTKD